MAMVDKAKNVSETAKGKVEKVAGRVTNDRSLEAKGKAHETAGNLKQAGEKVKDAAK